MGAGRELGGGEKLSAAGGRRWRERTGLEADRGSNEVGGGRKIGGRDVGVCSSRLALRKDWRETGTKGKELR